MKLSEGQSEAAEEACFSTALINNSPHEADTFLGTAENSCTEPLLGIIFFPVRFLPPILLTYHL